MSSPSLLPGHLCQVEELALESSELENWLRPSLAETLKRIGPAPHLNSRVELTLVAGVVGEPP